MLSFMTSPSSTPESASWLPAATFDNKIALVTGGGTGLGLQISRGLAALGATTVIASRDPNNHSELLAEAATIARSAP